MTEGDIAFLEKIRDRINQNTLERSNILLERFDQILHRLWAEHDAKIPDKIPQTTDG